MLHIYDGAHMSVRSMLDHDPFLEMNNSLEPEEVTHEQLLDGFDEAVQELDDTLELCDLLELQGITKESVSGIEEGCEAGKDWSYPFPTAFGWFQDGPHLYVARVRITQERWMLRQR